MRFQSKRVRDRKPTTPNDTKVLAAAKARSGDPSVRDTVIPRPFRHEAQGKLAKIEHRSSAPAVVHKRQDISWWTKRPLVSKRNRCWTPGCRKHLHRSQRKFHQMHCDFHTVNA